MSHAGIFLLRVESSGSESALDADSRWWNFRKYKRFRAEDWPRIMRLDAQADGAR